MEVLIEQLAIKLKRAAYVEALHIGGGGEGGWGQHRYRT